MRFPSFRRKNAHRAGNHRITLAVRLKLDPCESRETTNLLLVGGFTGFLGSELFALPDNTAIQVAPVQPVRDWSVRDPDESKSRAAELQFPVIAEFNSSALETARRATLRPTELSVTSSADGGLFSFGAWRFEIEPSPEPSVSLPRPSAPTSASDSSRGGEAGGPCGATLHRTTQPSPTTLGSFAAGAERNVGENPGFARFPPHAPGGRDASAAVSERVKIGGVLPMSGGGGGGEPAPGGFIVKSVEFKGDKFSPVFRDSGTEYNPPHWLDSDEDGSDNHPQLGDRQFPVTYGRNDTVKLKVEFKTLNGGWPLPTDPQLQLCVAGFGPNNIKTEIVCLGRPAGAISWQIPLTATEPLTTYVHAYQPFTIHWRAIWAAGAPTYEDSNWGTFGISSNPLYVTYEKARSTAYHSLVYNATVSAEGMSNWQIILNANWQSFTSFSIVWKEPKPWDIVNSTVPTQAQRLFYYGKWTIGEGSLATLLSDRDGQCGAWADFWTNEILVQGITEVSPELVRIDAPANEVGFLINSWKKENNGTSTDPTHPYKLTFQSITPRHGSNVLDEKKYNFLASDLKDMDGITSQGSGTFGSPNGHANPAADFNMHLVVLLNGRIYDPSYGRDFATIAAWEESAIYGYYKVPNASEWNVRENAPGKEVQTLTHPNLP